MFTLLRLKEKPTSSLMSVVAQLTNLSAVTVVAFDAQGELSSNLAAPVAADGNVNHQAKQDLAAVAVSEVVSEQAIAIPQRYH